MSFEMAQGAQHSQSFSGPMSMKSPRSPMADLVKTSSAPAVRGLLTPTGNSDSGRGDGRADFAPGRSVRQIVQQTLARPADKKTVRFKPVEQACVEVLKYKVSSAEDDFGEEDSSVRLSFHRSEPSFCNKCWQLWCAGDSDELEVEEAHTWMEVTLWKLNSSADLEVDGVDILSWRRRLFYLQEYDNKLALMYTSEKENGSLHLGCLIYHQAAGLAERTVLPTTSLQPISDETKETVIMSMREYDIAFSAKQNRDFYLDVMPQQLHPFSITWTDENGKQDKIILASVNAKVPNHLVESMASITQIMCTKFATADHRST